MPTIVPACIRISVVNLPKHNCYLLLQVKQRVLKSPPKKVLEPREKLMLEIRSQPITLKPVKDGKRVGK